VDNRKTLTVQISESLQRRSAGCEFQQLVADCSDFTWNQLFDEVDRLSRLGQLCMRKADNGRYWLSLPNEQPLDRNSDAAITAAGPVIIE
jgi:hypothetical protein